MKYLTGEELRVGDKVRIDSSCSGVVVCSVDADEYSAQHPKEQWSYLKVGVMIETDCAGLVHYAEPDEDLVLLQRNSDLC